MSKLTDATKNARQKASDVRKAAKQKAEVALTKGRDAAARGADRSRKMASKAKEKSGDAVDKNPLAIVAGGLAIGAIVAALLPRTEREKKLIGSAGKKINSVAKTAMAAAKDAGQATMKQVGLDGDTAKGQFKDLFGKATEAAKAAGQAAKDTVRKKD